MPCYQRSGLAHDFIELDLDFLSMKSDREAVHSAAEVSLCKNACSHFL